MDIVCTIKQEGSRSTDTERTAQHTFFGVSALLFVISTALTIHWCTGMSMGEMPMPGGWTMSMTWMRMCGQTWLAAAASFLAMWVAMMVAMMLPSLTPVLWRFYRAMGRINGRVVDNTVDQNINLARERLYQKRRFDSAQRPELLIPVAERSRSVLGLSGVVKSRVGSDQTCGMPSKTRPTQLILTISLGYFFIWTLLGVMAYPIGVAWTTIEMRSPMLANAVPAIASVVVLLAGALQFTAWKADRLDCCRAIPRCHLLPTNIVSAWRYGLRFGLHCIYCCAGLTAILFVIGIMDLRAMAVVTAAITIERLAPTASAARVIGIVIVVAGVLMIARAIYS